MQTVKEVSKRAGVSVRTLHHYDAIGLLKPTAATEAGYRLYDDGALARLQSILLFRELQFSLGEIKTILDNPAFDAQAALDQQIQLLELQRKRLDGLITFAREIKEKGVETMEFQAFDKRELERWRAEAKEKWGATAAYAEWSERESGGGDLAADQGLMALFAEIGALRGQSPADGAAQEKIAALQAFITGHYYHCTKEILAGLGRMYTGDPRFQAQIDRAGGDGTADFAAEAIACYCAAP